MGLLGGAIYPLLSERWEREKEKLGGELGGVVE